VKKCDPIQAVVTADWVGEISPADNRRAVLAVCAWAARVGATHAEIRERCAQLGVDLASARASESPPTRRTQPITLGEPLRARTGALRARKT